MGNQQTTNQLPLLSLRSQERMEHEHFDARVRLCNALNKLTYGRSDRLKIDSNPKVHEIVIAYAVEVFNIAEAEYRALNLKPDQRAAVMLTLVDRAYAETCKLLIPQCRVDLGELRDDAVFKKRLADELLRSGAEASVRAGVKGESKVATLVDDYLKRKSITLVEFAEKAHVDPTVIRALRHGQRKCGPEALQRIAKLLGCEVEELPSRSGATSKKAEKPS